MVAMTWGRDAVSVRMLCMPGLRSAMEELAAQCEAAVGHALAIRFGLPAQVHDALAADAFDVVAFNTTAIDALIAQDKVRRGTRADIARMGIGVAGRTGAPQPDISTADAFRRALLGASSISYTKDSAAGAYLANLMVRLGIAEPWRPRPSSWAGAGRTPGLWPLAKWNSAFV